MQLLLMILEIALYQQTFRNITVSGKPFDNQCKMKRRNFSFGTQPTKDKAFFALWNI